MMKYFIKPLEWGSTASGSPMAETPFGNYYVERSPKFVNGKWVDRFYWSYIFQERYDEGEFPCDSIEDGKQRAWEHWEGRLLKVLEAERLNGYRMRTAVLPNRPNNYKPVSASKKPKNLHRPGFIYLMHYPSVGAPYFKIGASKHPWRRYRQLHSDWNLNNVMLVACGHVENMAEAEEFVHEMFAPWHGSGNEYFVLPDDALVLAIYTIAGLAHEYKQEEFCAND